MRTNRQFSLLDNNTYREMNQLKYVRTSKLNTILQIATDRPKYSQLITKNQESITECGNKIKNRSPVSWEAFPKLPDTVHMLDR